MQLQTSDEPSSSQATYTMVNSDDPASERNMSQLFSSLPALHEATSLLTRTTSYFTHCFTGYADEVTPDEVNMDEFVSSSCANESPSSVCRSSFVRQSSLSHDACAASRCRNSGGTPSGSFSEHSTEIVTSTSTVNGLSIFQGLVDRARKTMHGSADDIGWLERAVDMAPVEDGTKRFTELLDNIRCNEHKLPNTLVYLLVPGLFSNHGPLYFVSTKNFFSKMGLACHIAKIHSEASVEKNAREIREYIEEIYWGSKKRVLLLGHSKGGVDAAAALSLYWDDLKDKVAGLALAQSPYGGSPIASDILREGQLGDYVNLRKITEIVICKVLKGDLQALEDLTYEKRKDFLTRHSLPPDLPVVSFHTEASVGPSVLGSLSHVAHAELPTVVDGQPAKLPVVMPLAAAMAACAQMLQARYGEKSDGLVTRRDAEVPGSVVVRPTKKMDHAWMVYAPLNDNSDEAESARVFEALLTLLVEVAQKRRHEVSLKDE